LDSSDKYPGLSTGRSEVQSLTRAVERFMVSVPIPFARHSKLSSKKMSKSLSGMDDQAISLE